MLDLHTLLASGYASGCGGRSCLRSHCCVTSASVNTPVNPPDAEPLWRQALRQLLNHGDPAVAQQTAAALAE
jgi:hypothetical protein